VLDEAIAAAHTMLKPGGVVGVVQHRAPENAADDWATGRAGYLKPSAVIEMFTEAGFTLAGSSEINANANDNPTEEDVVWRLPPSYAGGEDTKDAMDAIGESDRMTLRLDATGRAGGRARSSGHPESTRSVQCAEHSDGRRPENRLGGALR